MDNQQHRHQVFAEILANDKHLDCHSQRRRLVKALEQLGTVTTFEAMRKLDIYDPRARMPVLLVSLLVTCSTSPSYAESEKSLFGYAIATHYQALNKDSFILVDKVAVSGNNGRQELQNLFTTVSHRTLADVFLCLSFASLPFMGELRLALAMTLLWWGGGGNKPFIRRILPAVVVAVLNLPAALILGQIIKTSLPIRKVQQ